MEQYLCLIICIQRPTSSVPSLHKSCLYVLYIYTVGLLLYGGCHHDFEVPCYSLISNFEYCHIFTCLWFSLMYFILEHESSFLLGTNRRKKRTRWLWNGICCEAGSNLAICQFESRVLNSNWKLSTILVDFAAAAINFILTILNDSLIDVNARRNLCLLVWLQGHALTNRARHIHSASILDGLFPPRKGGILRGRVLVRVASQCDVQVPSGYELLWVFE